MTGKGMRSQPSRGGRCYRCSRQVDGCFVLRTQLRMYWTLGIYLEVAEEERLNRAASRDAKRLGGAEGVLARYRKRYLPAFDLYLERDDPIAHADVIVDNNDVDHPVVLRWPLTSRSSDLGFRPSGSRQAPTHRLAVGDRWKRATQRDRAPCRWIARRWALRVGGTPWAGIRLGADETPVYRVAWTEASARTRRGSGGCHGTERVGCGPRLRGALDPWQCAPPAAWSSPNRAPISLRRSRGNREDECARCRWRAVAGPFLSSPSVASASILRWPWSTSERPCSTTGFRRRSSCTSEAPQSSRSRRLGERAHSGRYHHPWSATGIFLPRCCAGVRARASIRRRLVDKKEEAASEVLERPPTQVHFFHSHDNTSLQLLGQMRNSLRTSGPTRVLASWRSFRSRLPLLRKETEV